MTDAPTTPAAALAEQERVLTRATDAVNEMLRGKLWLHVKTGGVYLEYGRGDTVFDKKAGDRLFSGIMGAPLIEATDDIPAGEMFVRYRNVITGEGWARPARLFDDGRFIPLVLAPAAHAEALERERWIPVEERLPEEGEYGNTCIVATACGRVMAMNYVSHRFAATEKGRAPRWEWNGRLPVWEVTHWRPLPAPPAPASAGSGTHVISLEHDEESSQRGMREAAERVARSVVKGAEGGAE